MSQHKTQFPAEYLRLLCFRSPGEGCLLYTRKFSWWLMPQHWGKYIQFASKKKMNPKLSAAYKALFQIPHLTIPRKERKHGCGRWLYPGPLTLVFKMYEDSLFLLKNLSRSELITQVPMSLCITGSQGGVCQHSRRSSIWAVHTCLTV